MASRTSIGHPQFHCPLGPRLPGDRIADPHPGWAKTDAYVSAEAACTMPRALRRVDIREEALAELGC